MLLVPKQLYLLVLVVFWPLSGMFKTKTQATKELRNFLKAKSNDSSLKYGTESTKVYLEKVLKKVGVNVHIDDEGRTCLDYAIRLGHAWCIDFLLQNGADHTTIGMNPLIFALLHGSCAHDVFPLLIKWGALEDFNFKGNTFFHSLSDIDFRNFQRVLKNNKEISDSIKQALRQCIARPNNAGLMPLHYAVKNKNEALVAWLLEHNAEIDIKDTKGNAPMVYAAELSMIKLLVKHGAKLDSLNKLGKTIFHLFSGEGLIDLCKPVEQQLVNQPDNNGVTPLLLAINGGRLAMVKSLLPLGVDSSSCDNNKNTILHYLALKELSFFNEVSKRLKLPMQDFLHKKNNVGMTPLHYAVQHDEGVVRLLLAAGADAESRDIQGRRPLHYATFDCALLLLRDYQVEPFSDEHGNTILHCLAHEKRKKERENFFCIPKLHELVRVISGIEVSKQQWARLKKKGSLYCLPNAPIIAQWCNKKNKDGKTALHLAAENGSAAFVKFLLFFGANVSLRDLVGKLPIHYSCTKEVVQVLFDHGADLNARDARGNTLLHLLAQSKNSFHRFERHNILKMLSEQLNAKNDEGQTPLLISILHNNSHMFYYLVSKKVDLFVTDALGKTILHYPIKLRRNDSILKEVRSCVTLKDDYGCTPLHYAAQRGCESSCNILIENVGLLYFKSSFINEVDKHGKTACHYALDNGHIATVVLLQKLGANFAYEEPSAPLAENSFEEELADPQYIHREEIDGKEDEQLGSLPQYSFQPVEYNVPEKIESHQSATLPGIGAKQEKLRRLLFDAIDQENVQEVERLLAHGCSVVVVEGFFPLHKAAQKQNIIIMLLLIKNGAPVNVQDQQGTLARDYLLDERRDLFDELMKDAR